MVITMTKEKIPVELLEIIVQMAHDEMGWIKRGLADNARQLASYNELARNMEGEFARLEKRVETLSESLNRFQQTIQKALES
jgi:hypothetical protein